MKQILILLLAATTLGFGCNKEDQSEIDRNLIVKYLEDNNLTAIEDESGLFYIVDVPGGEEKPTLSDNVTVTYKGYFLNGSVFDQTAEGQDISFPLTGVIKGWQIGIPKFGKGGSGQLFLPSDLAYGSRGSGSVGPNSVLIFDVELLDF